MPLLSLRFPGPTRTKPPPSRRDGARLSEIQAWGEDPKEHFTQGDDETALMHVESRAAAGSALHRKAIMEITINGAYADVVAQGDISDPATVHRRLDTIGATMGTRSEPELCVDEGCPHFGTKHVCVTSA